MADSKQLPTFYAAQKQKGSFVVTEQPKFDLDAYISNYSGRTRFARLHHIGIHSAVLGVEAFKAAVLEAKQHGTDVDRYILATNLLQEVSPRDPDAVVDVRWAENTTKQVKEETTKLESELNGYKNNLIKESVRMGNEDCSKHYAAMGEIGQAYKAAARMRDYCTSPKHVLDMTLLLVTLSIERSDWMAVQSNVVKIRHLSLKQDDAESVSPKLDSALGLAYLSSGKYAEAAISFLQTDPLLGNRFNQILSANDVAVYGGLTALASMDRDALQRQVLESSSFRPFLELEPHIRRAIALYVSSKYSACLAILEAYRADYQLDIYLHQHLDTLYAAIRSKSIIQYFIPFSRVTFAAMAGAFATSEAAIEKELVDMIENGSLDARVDMQDRVLEARTSDLRADVQAKALAAADRYEREAKARMFRMSVVAAGLEVKVPKNKGQNVSGAGAAGSGGGGGAAAAAAAGGGGSGGAGGTTSALGGEDVLAGVGGGRSLRSAR